MRKQLVGAVAAGLLVFVAGCGEDEAAGPGDVEEFCRLAALNIDDPTDEDFDNFVDAAPPEIREDAETLADAFRDLDPDDDEAALAALDDPEVAEALENLEAFQTENCTDDGSGSGGDDGSDDDETTTTGGSDDEETTTTVAEETTTTTAP